MAEVRDGLSGRVVRGWLSRMTPGPWAAADEGDSRGLLITVRGEDDEMVADLPTDRGHENAGPVAALPDVLRAYLRVTGEQLQVEQALAAAGVDEGGVAGVQALVEAVTEARDAEAGLERELGTQAAQWDATIREVAEARQQTERAEDRVGAVRGLLARWGARTLTPEQDDLYRELTGVLLTGVLHHDAHPEPEPDSTEQEAG